MLGTMVALLSIKLAEYNLRVLVLLLISGLVRGASDLEFGILLPSALSPAE